MDENMMGFSVTSGHFSQKNTSYLNGLTVNRTLGKGEAVSSILTSSTSETAEFWGADTAGSGGGIGRGDLASAAVNR
jgi:hypothetical protein